MAVYVDDMYKYRIGRFRNMRMSHMIADSSKELLAMADKLGLKHHWIQHPGTPKEHFDIPRDKRALAIELGAQPISMRALVQKVRDRRARAFADETKTDRG